MEADLSNIPPSVDPLAGDPGLDHLPPLEPGETLLWTGRPTAQGFAGDILSYDLAYLWIASCWCGLCLGLQYLFPALEPDMSRLVPAVLFVATPVFGAVLGVGIQLAWQVRFYRRTRYALTNDRALVVRPNGIRRLATKVYAADGGFIPTIVELRPDGSGSLVFLDPARQRRLPRWLMLSPGVLVGDGFENISHVRDVLRQSHAVFAAAANKGKPR